MVTRTFIAALGVLLLVAFMVAAKSPNPWPEDKPGAVQDAKDAPPEELNLVESLDGPSLFQASCAACHGSEANGAGPAASALTTAPPDLTRISERNGGTFPFTRIEKFISGESLNEGAHGSREMPVWGPIFGQIAWDQDLGSVRIYRITKYIESLQKKQLPRRPPFKPQGR